MRDDTDDYRRRVRLRREGGSALRRDEEQARATIRRLEGVREAGGSLSASQERDLRNAYALVRRSKKMSRRELVLRARRGWIA